MLIDKPQAAACASAGTAALAEGRFADGLALLHRAVADGDDGPVTLLNLAIAEERRGIPGRPAS